MRAGLQSRERRDGGIKAGLHAKAVGNLRSTSFCCRFCGYPIRNRDSLRTEDFMRRRPSERGSVLLLELLVVISILGVLLAMTAPSFLQMRMSQQASQALSTVRAIQNAEAYYLQIYHNGYVDPGALAGTGVALPTTCDAPLLLGGAQAQIQTNGYTYQFVAGPTPAALGVGCTAPGATTFKLIAYPTNGQGRSFFVNEFGIIHYSDSGTANSSSPAWFW
jgi:type II secretory pathway pseudopilin PulG